MQPIAFVFTGPESTGKTTLASMLAEYFKVDLVEEYAREYLNKKTDGKYDFEDLKKIADGQIALEEKAISDFSHQPSAISHQQNHKNSFYICDTDLITIKIWSEEVFGKAIRNQQSAISKKKPKLRRQYLLCSPKDVPWEFDPLRENPTDRDRLFDIYLKILKTNKSNFIVLEGNLEERFYLAKKFILDSLM